MGKSFTKTDPAGEFSTAMWPLSSRLLQLLKRGLARVGTWFTAEPPHHPREVHHGGTGTMLKVRFREADIARAAHATPRTTPQRSMA